MQLVYRQSTQIIQKQRIQIQHNRIKNPNWQEATSWLLPSVAKDVNSRMTENNWKSSQWPERDSNQGVVLRGRCSDHLACVGVGGGGALFWSLPRVCLCLGASRPVFVPLKRLAFVTRKPGKWEVEACGFLFFFFRGGGGGGSKRYVCMYAVAGEPSKEGVVTEHENGVCESEHLYCTQRFTFSPKCFIPVATVRNETVTLTITSTWMSTASQL